MKTYKKFMHIWLTVVSLFGFMAGWVMLGKASELKAQAATDFTVSSGLAPVPQITDPASQLANSPSLLSQVIDIALGHPAAPSSSVVVQTRQLRTGAS